MKICFLTERMRLGFGVDLVVDEEARRLVERGHEVSVVVIHADLTLTARPYELVVLGRYMPLGDFWSEEWARKALALAKVEADVWILQTPPFYNWARFLDGPAILMEHGSPPGHMFSREIGRHLDNMVETRFREVYGELLPCDAIVCTSRSLHEWLPDHAQRFSRIIPLSCDHYPRTPKADADALRASLGIGPDDCMILWVGRMQLENDEQPYKGFQDLLALIPLARRHLPNARFVLAGRVSALDKLKLENAGFDVLPNLSATELGCAYAAADVLINLSKWEGFNLALLECSFQGTPPIAFDLGPHPEIVRHGETGLLAKDSQDFLRTIVRAAQDRPLLRRLGEQAEAWAAKFNWNANVDHLEKLALECFAKRLPRDETLALRHEKRDAAAAKAPRPPRRDRVVSARELYALDGGDFVQAARRSLLATSPDEQRESVWLRRLRRGARKDALLLELSDIARSRGMYREIAGLEQSLLRARALRAIAHLFGGDADLASIGGKEWDELQDAVFIQQAYRVLLGREAAPQEVAEKVAALQRGGTRAGLIAEIRFSGEGAPRLLEDPELQRMLAPEIMKHLPSVQRPGTIDHETALAYSRWQRFADQLVAAVQPISRSRWLQLPDEAFVRLAHATLLGRDPSPQELSARLEQMHQGRTRRAMLAELRFSAAGRDRRLTDRDLRRILLPEILARRSPEPQQAPARPPGVWLRDFLECLRGLWAPPPASPWFQMDDEAFVRQAFQSLLGRQVDPATAAGLTEQLRQGRSRRSVLAELRFSGEGRNRQVLDPVLQRILVRDSLLHWLGASRGPGDHEPEDDHRRLRRVDSRQRALQHRVAAIDSVAAGVAEANRALGAVTARLDAVESNMAWRIADAASRAPAPRESRHGFEPFGSRAAPLRLGASHVGIVAPGAMIDPAAMSKLAETAQWRGSDLVYGNEIEGEADGASGRLRILGPFSHADFLREPDLGGVVAVRTDLLELLGLPVTTALTPAVLLQLVGGAHTITHLDATLSRRPAALIARSRPGIEEVRAYVARTGRQAVVARERDDAPFEVRFTEPSRWKAAIVLVATPADDVDRTLRMLRGIGDAHHVAVARLSAPPARPARFEAEAGDSADPPIDTRFARAVNAAIAGAPADCNLVAVLHAGLAPSPSDWLERLAASALRTDTGVVAPLAVDGDRNVVHAGMGWASGDAIAYLERFTSVDAAAGAQREAADLRGIREVPAVARDCMVFRRAVFDDFGGFDETIDTALVDVDFCVRLRRVGLPALVDGRVVLIDGNPAPEWAREIAPDDLQAFVAKYGRPLATAERVVAPEAGTHSVALPPLEAR